MLSVSQKSQSIPRRCLSQSSRRKGPLGGNDGACSGSCVWPTTIFLFWLVQVHCNDYIPLLVTGFGMAGSELRHATMSGEVSLFYGDGLHSLFNLVMSAEDVWKSCCHIAMNLRMKPVFRTAEQRHGRTWDLDYNAELLDQQIPAWGSQFCGTVSLLIV